LYQLADLYVFPTLPGRKGCIEIPLSVLEAMACNIKSACTRFGGLPDIFEEGRGFYFIDCDKNLVNIVEKSQENNLVRTREMANQYAWKSVTKKILTELL
jgi:glycosyltransferase involved in cell wall biosynthesis